MTYKINMRAVIQRCEKTTIYAESDGDLQDRGSIGKGLLVLLGVEDGEKDEDLEYLLRKIVNLRIFNDGEGKMNLSVQDIQGSVAVVSQFTLHANTKKGNRPSFNRAGDPKKAEFWYDKFVENMQKRLNHGRVISGIFGAYMKVDFVNEGPVTIVLDSKNKEF